MTIETFVWILFSILPIIFVFVWYAPSLPTTRRLKQEYSETEDYTAITKEDTMGMLIYEVRNNDQT